MAPQEEQNPAEAPQSEGKMKMSRRQLITRAGAAGITLPVISSLVAACGGGSSSTASASAAASAAGGASAAASAGGAYDPMKYAGTTVRVLLTGDENDHRALQDMAPQLEAETGIKLEITAPALGALIEKTLQNLKAEASSFEIIEYLGFLTTQQVGAGLYEQLNSYIDNPAETPPDWDFNDFLPAAMKNVAIFDIPNKTLGAGTNVYGLPGLHSGSVIYFYRKDLFDQAGLAAPKTWDDFMAAAEKLNSPEVAGCSFIGANDFSLATVDWFTRFITTGGVLMNGSPTDGTFMPNVNSPEGVAALQMLIDYLPFAPKNVTSYGFAENVDGFSTGKIAQMIFWSTIAGPIFDPNKSMVADKTSTSQVPAAPGQTPRAILGGWGIGIPANADPALKPAAWRALTWMTSKEFNKYEVQKYQIDANRISTFQDPELVAQFPYLPNALAAMESAEIIPTSRIDEFFQLNDMMNAEFNGALVGSKTAKQACDNVQKQWEDVMKKAGYLKA